MNGDGKMNDFRTVLVVELIPANFINKMFSHSIVLPPCYEDIIGDSYLLNMFNLENFLIRANLKENELTMIIENKYKIYFKVNIIDKDNQKWWISKDNYGWEKYK